MRPEELNRTWVNVISQCLFCTKSANISPSLCFSDNTGCCVCMNELKQWNEFISANGCTMTEWEKKIKGFWILSRTHCTLPRLCSSSLGYVVVFPSPRERICSTPPIAYLEGRSGPDRTGPTAGGVSNPSGGKHGSSVIPAVDINASHNTTQVTFWGRRKLASKYT